MILIYAIPSTGSLCPSGATDRGFETAATCMGCLGPAAAMTSKRASLLFNTVPLQMPDEYLGANGGTTVVTILNLRL